MKRTFLVLALCGLLLMGCGERGNGDAAVDDRPGTGQETHLAGDMSRGNSLSVKAVQTMHFEEPEEGYASGSVQYRFIGKEIYMLRVERSETEDTTRLCVQVYDTDKDKVRQHVVTPQITGHEDSFIFSADLTADMKLSLKMRDAGADGFFQVKADLEGNILEITEPFPEETYPWNLDSFDDLKSFGLSDGRVILCRNDTVERKSVLTWFQEEDGAESPLGVLQDDFVNSLLADGEGVLYYLGGNSLVRWDVEGGTREELFLMHENGVETAAEASGLIKDETGDILLCRMRQGKGTIYVLTAEEVTDKEQIRLSCLQRGGISYIQRQAATFTQNGGEISISLEMESREDYEEDYRNRIMAELVAGKGPDILYVWPEDMILLQEKGVLLDLSDMIPQETKDVLIPGVLELGTVNGQLVGLVPEVHFETLATPVQVWGEDGWNLEELIDILETGDDWECPFHQVGVRHDGYTLLYRFLFLGDSSILDVEQGTCRFDSREFIRLLELCRKYGDERPSEKKWEDQLSLDERYRLMQEGEVVAETLHLFGGVDAYSSAVEHLGEYGHIVGYPTESGSGNYVDSYSYGYLVVNAQTKYREEIGKFFSLLLSYDNQFKTDGGCVRMDVIRDCVVYDEWHKRYFMLRSSDLENREIQEIALKPDGTTYMEEYLAFVESCEPVPYIPQQIVQIVREETAPFFEGSKEAEDVAGIIQRRVQLYLDETR
ncbi:MAG: extracellular solute-binding protein [Lachnospiraceae bacterium]|nr:extracellular solute-binding protein [Lachnospiraceae bacterium]